MKLLVDRKTNLCIKLMRFREVIGNQQTKGTNIETNS